eukprot:Pgem_evm2s5187
MKPIPFHFVIDSLSELVCNYYFHNNSTVTQKTQRTQRTQRTHDAVYTNFKVLKLEED